MFGRKMTKTATLNQQALTLVELLGVVGILGVLVALAIGPIQKARRNADLKIYKATMRRVYPSVREDLQKFYSGKTNFPAWTASDLHKMGIFDKQLLRWMEAGWVIYHPFSSDSPDKHLVISFYSHTGPNGVSVWPGLSKSNIFHSTAD
jgi:competence protein ComGC